MSNVIQFPDPDRLPQHVIDQIQEMGRSMKIQLDAISLSRKLDEGMSYEEEFEFYSTYPGFMRRLWKCWEIRRWWPLHDMASVYGEEMFDKYRKLARLKGDL